MLNLALVIVLAPFVGFLLQSAFGRRLPREGDLVHTERYILEVIDMDMHRVDKVLITRTPASLELDKKEA